MKLTKEQKSKLERKLWDWTIPRELFGNVGCDIYDFEIYNYTFLLDNAKSLQQLRAGLQHLSPLADDALAVAEGMNEQDFIHFKGKLPLERKGESSGMPERYGPLIIPAFTFYVLLAEKAGAPLGATLLRVIEEGYEPNRQLEFPPEVTA